ncbi:MAG: RidA family protein [Planctomycetaceae bacterium]|jgi:2-iminobutanoate/2-iminopropanoate deaminase|nr:RidA family protein [Planctomycetaceae bacterium]
MITIKTENAPAAIGPYSQGIIANGLLFTAGQIPLDPKTMKLVEGSIVEQTTQVLKNLDAILAESGSSWSRVVKTTVFLTDLNDFAQMNKTYAEHLNDSKPARSTVQVAALPLGAKIEIELIAEIEK